MKNKRNKLIIILSWMAVMVWLGVIYYLSAQTAAESNQLSKGLTEILIDKFGRFISLSASTDNPADIALYLNNLVRKLAHFMIYFVLGLLVVNAFRQIRVKGVKGPVFSFFFCLIFSISDECHQFFVLGRGPQYGDVIVDVLGALGGILVFLIVYGIVRSIRSRFGKRAL